MVVSRGGAQQAHASGSPRRSPASIAGRIAPVARFTARPFAHILTSCGSSVFLGVPRSLRYADFYELHVALTAQLGWQLKDAKFPPKRSMVLNKLNINFIETRRTALDAYWQQVQPSWLTSRRRLTRSIARSIARSTLWKGCAWLKPLDNFQPFQTSP